MAIINMQRRLAEVGRIRIGQQIPTKSGKTRPAKLDRFRLTSRDRRKIEAAAAIFGGEAQPWNNPGGDNEFEVVTETAELAVIVPPGAMAFDQWFELWSGGGCLRRCDGQREIIGDQPCQCDPDPQQRECSPHTRINVMLADLQGIGVWRLDTQGWNAAQELSAAIEICQAASAHGNMLPARLRLEQRQRKQPGKQTRKFAVPVLDLDVSFAGAVQAARLPVGGDIGLDNPSDNPGPDSDRAELEAPTFTPVAENKQLPEAPAPAPVAEQVQVKPRRRKRSGPPLKTTGLEPTKRSPDRPTPNETGASVAPPADPGEPDPKFRGQLAMRLRKLVPDSSGIDADLWRHALVESLTRGEKHGLTECDGHELQRVAKCATGLENETSGWAIDEWGQLLVTTGNGQEFRSNTIIAPDTFLGPGDNQ